MLVRGDIHNPLFFFTIAMIPLGLAVYGTATGKAVFKNSKVYRAKNPVQYWLLLAFEYAMAAYLISLAWTY